MRRGHECPWSSRDAYDEGRRSRSYDDNPYEHGKYESYGRCRDAYDEWERGHRRAEEDRRIEREEEELAERRQAERARCEREQAEAEEYAAYVASQQDAAYLDAMEAQYQASQLPDSTADQQSGAQE